MLQLHKSFAFLFLSFLPTPSWAADSNSEGIKAFRAGDYAKAERFYIQALTEESDRSKVASIYRNLALLYKTQGKDGSDFEKKADQVDPPLTPMVIKKSNGDVLIYHGKHSSPEEEAPAVKAFPQANPFMNTAPPMDRRGTTDFASQAPARSSDPSAGNTPPFFTGVGSYSSFTNSQFGAGFGYNPSRGGFNGGFNARSSAASPLPFYYGPQMGGINYSSVGPNGAFGYSDSTPIIIPVPYGYPVILNAPGPNIYSNRRGPDGSNTTFMLRTE